MNENPRAHNVLYNEAAMAVLEDAFARLKALGLYVHYGPDSTLQESDMSAVLRVSPSREALDECLAASQLAGLYIGSVEGRKHFDKELAEFRSVNAILKAMDSSGRSAS
jgi:hypothetical protein